MFYLMMGLFFLQGNDSCCIRTLDFLGQSVW